MTEGLLQAKSIAENFTLKEYPSVTNVTAADGGGPLYLLSQKKGAYGQQSLNLQFLNKSLKYFDYILICKGGKAMETKKILVADDEERIVKLVSDFLKISGYEVLPAADGSAALEIFNNNPDIALAIIDIMMPELDGWALTKEIRKTSDIPIIMLSARAEEFDLLTGFESGIDEYVTKPFSPAVLVKRVDALIKRSDGKVLPEDEVKKGLYIDTNAFVAYIDGKALELTLKEFELLSYLYENSGRVLTRDQLLNAIWGYDYLGDSRTVDSHIARLRTKLGDYGAAHLKTIYGMGYKLEV